MAKIIKSNIEIELNGVVDKKISEKEIKAKIKSVLSDFIEKNKNNNGSVDGISIDVRSEYEKFEE